MCVYECGTTISAWCVYVYVDRHLKYTTKWFSFPRSLLFFYDLFLFSLKQHTNTQTLSHNINGNFFCIQQINNGSKTIIHSSKQLLRLVIFLLHFRIWVILKQSLLLNGSRLHYFQNKLDLYEKLNRVNAEHRLSISIHNIKYIKHIFICLAYWFSMYLTAQQHYRQHFLGFYMHTTYTHIQQFQFQFQFQFWFVVFSISISNLLISILQLVHFQYRMCTTHATVVVFFTLYKEFYGFKFKTDVVVVHRAHEC